MVNFTMCYRIFSDLAVWKVNATGNDVMVPAKTDQKFQKKTLCSARKLWVKRNNQGVSALL